MYLDVFQTFGDLSQDLWESYVTIWDSYFWLSEVDDLLSRLQATLEETCYFNTKSALRSLSGRSQIAPTLYSLGTLSAAGSDEIKTTLTSFSNN